MINKMLKNLSEGKKVLGTWSMTSSVTAAEVLATSGLDFVIIDMEHSCVSFETAENMVRACELHGCSAVIRLYNSDEQVILRALETGCSGIMVPHVKTKEDAQKVVNACLYPPLGKRGLSPYTRNHSFSHEELESSLAENNRKVMVGVLVEGEEGINNVSEISKVEGIDLIYTGVYDISSSIGLAGQLDHPKVLEIQKTCIDIVKANGKAPGTFANNEEYLDIIVGLGYTFLAYSADGYMLKNSYRNVRQKIS